MGKTIDWLQVEIEKKKVQLSQERHTKTVAGWGEQTGSTSEWCFTLGSRVICSASNLAAIVSLEGHEKFTKNYHSSVDIFTRLW